MNIPFLVILFIGGSIPAFSQVNTGFGKPIDTCKTSTNIFAANSTNSSDKGLTGIPGQNDANNLASVHVLSFASQPKTAFLSTLQSGSGYDMSLQVSAIIGNAAGTATGVAGFSFQGNGMFAKSANGFGLQALSETGIGAHISNNSGNSPALFVSSYSNSFAAQIFSSNNTNKRALHTDGKLKFTGINEQVHTVLKGDINGNATWGKNMMAAAYGEINYDASIVKGSGNFFITWDANNKEYTIVFTNDGSAMNIPLITERSNSVGLIYYEPTVHIINSNQFKVKKRRTDNGLGDQFAFFFVVF